MPPSLRSLAPLVMGVLLATSFGAMPSSAAAPATIHVPRDHATIQAAVDAASEGATIVVAPGVYEESVVVRRSGVTIRGVDRFRTVLHGRDRLNNGIIVDGQRGVTIANLTVRNYANNGIFFVGSDDYRMAGIDAIKNGVYGLYAFDSVGGIIERSFAWGSGDAGIYIGECLECDAVVRRVHAEWNLIGYSGTNATGVVIEDSTWINNAVGIMPNTLPYERLGPNRGGIIRRNKIAGNNNEVVPPASIWTVYGVPTGTGVWLLGVQGNVVAKNRITGHERYGVLISQTTDIHLPMNNRVESNRFATADGYPIAWDGTGAGNCFQDNDLDRETAPPMLQTIYSCDNPPLPGVLYPPVHGDVMLTLLTGSARDGGEIPEPRRPRCQRGRRGCNR